jgi:hypothetical protein
MRAQFNANANYSVDAQLVKITASGGISSLAIKTRSIGGIIATQRVPMLRFAAKRAVNRIAATGSARIGYTAPPWRSRFPSDFESRRSCRPIRF